VTALKQAAEAAEDARVQQLAHSAQQHAQLSAMRPVAEAHDHAVARRHELQRRLEVRSNLASPHCRPGLLGSFLWYRPGPLCQCRFRIGYIGRQRT
jgi:hypothetical protein